MVIGLCPQLVLHRLSMVSPPDLVGILRPRLDEPNDRGCDRKCDYLRRERRQSEPGDPGVLALHDDIDGKTDQDFGKDVAEGVEHREEDCDRNFASMRLGVMEKANERMHAKRPLITWALSLTSANPDRENLCERGQSPLDIRR